ncbi:MAG: phosphoribosylformylglycinamidine cyclo-ligase [Geminicoccaceae bacterium]
MGQAGSRPPARQTEPIDAYARAGVDITKADRLVARIAPLATATRRPGWTGGIGGFGGVFDPSATGFKDPLLVAATDGVGTKLLLAEDHGRWRGIGQDLVAMCVNDLVVQGAAPWFFLDYIAGGRLEEAAIVTLIEDIADACKNCGCALIGGETAELPGLYPAGRFDLAGFALGAVERTKLLPRTGDIEAGDKVLALTSNGIHANGFSLVRKILAEEQVSLDAPAPFAGDASLAEILFAPTRLYTKAALAAATTDQVPAMVHVTGGGLLDNPPRVLPAGLGLRLDLERWPLPPVFAWLAAGAGLSRAELARTFNCGLGFLIIVKADGVRDVTDSLAEAGTDVVLVGEIEERRRDGAPVRLVGEGDGWPSA